LPPHTPKDQEVVKELMAAQSETDRQEVQLTDIPPGTLSTKVD
jgi:hypothetical protein